MEIRKDSNVLLYIVITIIVCFLVLIPLGIFMGKVLFESGSVENELKENSESGENIINEIAIPKCEGLRNSIYEGEYHETKGFLQLHEYFTLTLNADGTFSAEWKNSEGYTGTYTIENNVLTTKYKRWILGETEVTDMTKTYNVSTDCSMIEWDSRYNIYLKK